MRPIPVTRTFLPPQAEYQAILSRAWEEGWITNRGHLVKELEDELCSYLEVSNVICTTNGTLPLQIAIKALGIRGEVITTPFSYVATASSIVWEGCIPVFVDIHPEYLTIDEGKIEDAITKNTTAILATHVYGNPCNVEVIDEIAKRRNLKVIYDAAHCFGVKYKGKSILEFGDVSTCSFHATKIFHTGEGGALFFHDSDLYNSFFYHHNFGHKGKEAFQGLGINAKMSELQAALGLSVLMHIDEIIYKRKLIHDIYSELLLDSPVMKLRIRNHTEWNFSYFPVLFESEDILLRAVSALNDVEVFPRRYFYPSLTNLDYVSGHTPVADNISSRILCLPSFHDLQKDDQKLIVNTIINQITRA